MNWRRYWLAASFVVALVFVLSERSDAASEAHCSAYLRELHITAGFALAPSTIRIIRDRFPVACANDVTARRILLLIVKELKLQQLAVRGVHYATGMQNGTIRLNLGGTAIARSHYLIGFKPVKQMQINLVEIIGEAVEGQELTLRYAVTPSEMAPEVQWLRDAQPIKEARGFRYKMSRADIGKRISARLRAPAGSIIANTVANRLETAATQMVAALPREEGPADVYIVEAPIARPDRQLMAKKKRDEKIAEMAVPTPDIRPEDQIDKLYDLLFEDPSNLQLNFLLVEAQTKTGDLKGAMATLERVLLIDPDSKLARILLAETQYSLGDAKTAKLTLLQLISEADTPADMRDRARTVVDLIEDEEQLLAYNMTGSLAYGFAANARGAADSQTILFIDLPVQNTLSDESESFIDTQIVGSLIRELTTQTDQKLGATFIFNRRDYENYNEADLDTVQLTLSYNVNGDVPWSAGINVTNVAVNRNDYLSAIGVTANASLPIGSAYLLSLGGGVTENSYSDLPGGSGAELRDGTAYSLTAGLNMGLAGLPFSFNANHADNNARRAYYANTINGVGFRTALSLFDWQTGLRFNYRLVDYDGADPLVSSTIRSDKAMALNVTGQKVLRRNRGGAFLMTIKADHNQTNSNLPNYEKDTQSLSLGISQQF